MALIDKEQLKAEIERQIHMLRSSIMSQGDYGQSCHIVAYENILSFLDTLPEQPVEGLEEEIERYCGPYNKRPVPDFIETVARHFTEWGAKHLKK